MNDGEHVSTSQANSTAPRNYVIAWWYLRMVLASYNSTAVDVR